MKAFIPFPAVDLRGGQVVRLKEGDLLRQTNYSNDPAATAERWLSAGAAWLHVVNLDGAFDQADSANRSALKAILRVAGRYNARIQFGGGLRSAQAVAQVMELGVERAVIGTLAVQQLEILDLLLSTWDSDHIGVSLDARDGLVQVRGWQESTTIQAIDAVRNLEQIGLEWLVFTDIARDGLQKGINLAATLELARASHLNVIASGGVRGVQDIRAARQAGLAGIIAGRALYEGTLRIEELLEASREPGSEEKC
jgi:phosphoribosylformimino-5-aminoimidazole carboxamide ribotide isomerase